MSAMIAASGKTYERFCDPKTTVEKARRHLGQPSWSRQYSPAMPINETLTGQLKSA